MLIQIIECSSLFQGQKLWISPYLVVDGVPTAFSAASIASRANAVSSTPSMTMPKRTTMTLGPAASATTPVAHSKKLSKKAKRALAAAHASALSTQQLTSKNTQLSRQKSKKAKKGAPARAQAAALPPQPKIPPRKTPPKIPSSVPKQAAPTSKFKPTRMSKRQVKKARKIAKQAKLAISPKGLLKVCPPSPTRAKTLAAMQRSYISIVPRKVRILPGQLQLALKSRILAD